MAMQFTRVRFPASAFAMILCCIQASALDAEIVQAHSQETKKEVRRISLKLRREIPLEHPLLMPQDHRWVLKRVIAMHPDGRRVAVLIPGKKEIALRQRTESGLTERSFLLAWVELSTGRLLSSRELSLTELEPFGFVMADKGDLFCVIAGQKVMILNETFSTVDWTHSRLSRAPGEERIVTGCSFFPGATSVLVTYVFRTGPPWEWRSSLMQWNWREKSASLYHWDQFVVDAVPLRENRVLVYRSMPDWVFRFRLEDVELRSRNASLVGNMDGFPESNLVLSNELVVRAEWKRNGVSESASEYRIPERFHDYNKALQGFRIRRRDQSVEGTDSFYVLEDKVVVWDRDSIERATEFRVRGLALQWPLCIAGDNSWFAVSAIDYSHRENDDYLSWKSNQFMIFSLDGSKRRLYASEKFGPKEAITGLALSRDDKTLVVATSRRLLIYEVKAISAS